MAEIKLTKGKVAIVDDCDVPMLKQYSWNAHQSKADRTWYAKTNISFHGWRGTITMHRLILGTYFTRNTIDHIDGDGLNNKRVNLRWVSKTQHY